MDLLDVDFTPTESRRRVVEAVEAFVTNTCTMRQSWMKRQTDPCRDIDKECGYPEKVDLELYRSYYEREGIATRVVDVWPSESWKLLPFIYEKDDNKESDFETAFKELDAKTQLLPYIQRVDTMSGIGQFGVLLLGLNDGRALSEPVEGIDKYGKPTAKAPKDREIIYMRSLDQYLVNIQSFETDPTNPRYGQPLLYEIKFIDYATTSKTGTGQQFNTINVHWSRIIHVADNRTTSEVLGTPRMQTVINYLYNIKKILGGSSEMFWKGGFPGLSFEEYPDTAGNVRTQMSEAAINALKSEMALWSNGLQRFLTLSGGSVKSLAPQVADPTNHLTVSLQAIAITHGVPLRVLMGSEQGSLASSQDAQQWNSRIKARQDRYLTPYVVRPTVERLQAIGVLPRTKKAVQVVWPDLNTLTDNQKSDALLKKMQAIAQYVGSGAFKLIPPELFFQMFCGMTQEEIAALQVAASWKDLEKLIAKNDGTTASGKKNGVKGQSGGKGTAGKSKPVK